jgi:hypothetical protein
MGAMTIVRHRLLLATRLGLFVFVVLAVAYTTVQLYTMSTASSDVASDVVGSTCYADDYECTDAEHANEYAD